MALTRRPGRDAVTWIALGLVVVSILIVTARHVGASKPRAPSPKPTLHETSFRAATPAARSVGRADGPKRPPYGASRVQSSTSDLPAVSTTTEVTTTTSPSPSNSLPVLTNATLSYPGDVATTYPLSIKSGPVRATLTWHRGIELSLALTCGASEISRHSERGTIGVTMHRAGSDCLLEIARPSIAGPPVAYSLALTYLASGSATSK
ncbi:MAG TPA: hypothetical protein VMU99_09385 [Acidimicrobiales bacterium]|nr:hypothetical protein [Acidimicrobiales bacterium]